MGHWGLQLRSFSARIGHHEPSTRYSISSASSHSLRILERSLEGRGADSWAGRAAPSPPRPAARAQAGCSLNKPLPSLQKRFKDSTHQGLVS